MIDKLLRMVGLQRWRRQTNLFQTGKFTLASGLKSDFKIECDALTDEDWDTIAFHLRDYAEEFGEVIGVPRGGLKLARALQKFCDSGNVSGPRLVVDDVITTGGSIRKLMTRPTDVGLVLFARDIDRLPPGVCALFTMTNWRRFP
jgi:orotate phosphoribosyltransferase